MQPQPTHEPTEAERTRRAVVLGAVLGLVLVLLGRRRRSAS
jgi:hypothetical protein